MVNRQVDTKITKQVRIDAGWHQLAKEYAARAKTTIKALVEEGLEIVLMNPKK